MTYLETECPVSALRHMLGTTTSTFSKVVDIRISIVWIGVAFADIDDGTVKVPHTIPAQTASPER